MTLGDIASVVEIVGIVALLYGLYFGAMQLRQNRKQRRDHAIMECARWFVDDQFLRSYKVIQELASTPEPVPFAELDSERQFAALRIAMKFETIGLLIQRGVIPLDAMEELVGGAALATWPVLEAYIRDTRETGTNPTFMEWFQWLVEHMKNPEAKLRQPAFVRYADWREPKV